MLGGTSPSRAAAQSPGGLTDLFAPPCGSPVLPEFPRLDVVGPVSNAAPPEEQAFVPLNSWSNLHPGDLRAPQGGESDGRRQSGANLFRGGDARPERPLAMPSERGEWSREDTLKMPVVGALRCSARRR